MAATIEFLFVFLLTISLLLILTISFNNILAKSKYVFLYTHNSKTLSNFSLFAGLSYSYSSSLSYLYTHQNKTFNVFFNKINYGGMSMDSIAEINLGGVLAKSNYLPT
ncbi:MAG: hypothetical protein ACK4J0_01320 [Candidatus Anstonellaceae archaeon]